MIDKENNAELAEALQDLREATEYLESIRADFADDPELLSFYEPSAKEMVRQFQVRLSTQLSKAFGIEFVAQTNEDNVDVWIRLEGEQFHDGKGPIGVIGSYLQKLNVANKHAVNLIAQTKDSLSNLKDKLSDLASFDLVATAEGSLKLGLKRHSFEDTTLESLEGQQLYFFNEQRTTTDDTEKEIPEVVNLDQLALDGFRLLAKTVASANNRELFNELKNQYSDKGVLKLIHYAKELVPSSRSPIECISFEGRNLQLPTDTVKTDKHTRKSLIDRAKSFKNDTVFVEGSGWIRAVDMDNYTGTIRPFHYKNKQLEEIECRFPHENFQPKEIASLIDQLVSLTGFLIFNKNDTPIRLEIDNIFVQEEIEEVDTE